jgi:hypothetical protein
MPPIELRQSKASMTPMLLLLSLVATGIFIYLVYSRKSGFNPIKIIMLIGACFMAYAVWYTVKKLRKNEPLLTFTKEALEINETKPATVLWQAITSWDVRRSDATDYLVINTEDKRFSINISWLEVKPAEVEALMIQYIEKSKSNRF